MTYTTEQLARAVGGCPITVVGNKRIYYFNDETLSRLIEIAMILGERRLAKADWDNSPGLPHVLAPPLPAELEDMK